MKKNRINDALFALGIGVGGAAIIYVKLLRDVTRSGQRHFKKRIRYTSEFVKQKGTEVKNTHQENILKIKTELKGLVQVLEQM